MAFIEFEALHQVGPHQLKPEAFSLHAGWENNPIGSHPFEHFFVEVARGSCDYAPDAGAVTVFGNQGCGDARLDRFTDRHHHGVHVEDASFPQ